MVGPVEREVDEAVGAADDVADAPEVLHDLLALDELSVLADAEALDDLAREAAREQVALPGLEGLAPRDIEPARAIEGIQRRVGMTIAGSPHGTRNDESL